MKKTAKRAGLALVGALFLLGLALLDLREHLSPPPPDPED